MCVSGSSVLFIVTGGCILCSLVSGVMSVTLHFGVDRCRLWSVK